MIILTPSPREKASIVDALKLKHSLRDALSDEQVRAVYNDAIDDACNFASTLAKHNPQFAMALTACAQQMRGLEL